MQRNAHLLPLIPLLAPPPQNPLPTLTPRTIMHDLMSKNVAIDTELPLANPTLIPPALAHARLSIPPRRRRSSTGLARREWGKGGAAAETRGLGFRGFVVGVGVGVGGDLFPADVAPVAERE